MKRALTLPALLLACVLACAEAHAADTVTLVSQTPAQEKGNGDSGADEPVPDLIEALPSPVLDNGSVFFISAATNLVDADTTLFRDVYLRLQNGTLQLASRVLANGSGTNLSQDVVQFHASADGSVMAAVSAAEAFALGLFEEGADPDNDDTFLWDYNGDEVMYASFSSFNEELGIWFGASGTSADPAVSGDGRWLAYRSDSDNIVAGDDGLFTDIFLFDRQTKTNSRITLTLAGDDADGDSDKPAVANDGTRIVFRTAARNLADDGAAGADDIILFDSGAGTFTRISRTIANADSTADAVTPAISADGTVVAYASTDPGRVWSDSNGVSDIFVYTIAAKTTQRVSVSSTGTEADGASSLPQLNGDGRFVVFTSTATNLSTAATNGLLKVFIHDRDTGATTLISRNAAGQTADAGCYAPAISPSGRYVTFSSKSTNLAGAADGGVFHVFLVDRGADYLNHAPVARSLDVSSNPNPATASVALAADDADDDTLTFRITQMPANGTLTTAQAAAVNTGDPILAQALPLIYTPNAQFTGNDSFAYTAEDGMDISAEAQVNVVVHDFTASVPIVRLSENGGDGGDEDSQKPILYNHNLYPSISDDGGHVAFVSAANNLVTGAITPVTVNAFRHNAATGLRLISVTAGGDGGNQNSSAIVLSPDGTYAVFESQATDITNPAADVFKKNLYIRDLVTGAITPMPVNAGISELLYPSAADGKRIVYAKTAGYAVKRIIWYNNGWTLALPIGGGFGDPDGNSDKPVISRNSLAVAFESDAANLVDSDDNNLKDVFVFYLETPRSELVSIASDGGGANGASQTPSISFTGRFIAFSSAASNLVTDDANGVEDIFVRDMSKTEDAIIRVTAGADAPSSMPAISAGGRFVYFRSLASNIGGGSSGTSWQAYVYDRGSGTTRRLSTSAGGLEGDADSYGGALSATGRIIVFASKASNLVTGDDENRNDVFKADQGTPANALPAIQNAAAETVKNTPVTIALIATDADGDDLVFEITAGPGAGSLGDIAQNISPDHPVPTVQYTPDADTVGDDTFTFRVHDAVGYSNTATVTVTVTNTAPTATAANVPLPEDSDFALPPLTGNDADGDDLTFTVSSAPQNGNLTGAPPNLVYHPDPNYFGPDQFGFTANDGFSDSAEAIITIDVTPVPDAPVLRVVRNLAMDATALQGDITQQMLILEDPDFPDGAPDTFLIHVDADPLKGNLVDSGGNAVGTETPAPTYADLPLRYTADAPETYATDSVRFIAEDETGRMSEPVTLNIVIGAELQTLQLFKRWNFVSFRMRPTFDDPVATFQIGGQRCIVGGVWHWNLQTGMMEIETQLRDGIGYWVYANEDCTIENIPGQAVADPNVPVNTGWNSTGPVGAGASTPLPTPEDGVQGTIWKWNGAKQSFQPSDRLEGGRGYLIRVLDGTGALDLGLEPGQ